MSSEADAVIEQERRRLEAQKRPGDMHPSFTTPNDGSVPSGQEAYQGANVDAARQNYQLTGVVQSNMRNPSRLEREARSRTIATWVGAVALVILALVAILWTVELVAIQRDLHDVLEQVKGQLRALGGLFGGETEGGGYECDPTFEEC